MGIIQINHCIVVVVMSSEQSQKNTQYVMFADEILAEADISTGNKLGFEAHIKYGISGPSLNSTNLKNHTSYYQRDELNVMLTSAQNTEVR